MKKESIYDSLSEMSVLKRETQISTEQLARKFEAYKNCVQSKNEEWEEKHQSTINEILERLPHGSGLDNGVRFDWIDSKPDRLIFVFEYHHMKDGYYVKWTNHKLVITPSFQSGLKLHITGDNYNEIKDYLYDLFNEIFIR